MKAVILAAGAAKRLLPLTREIPKCMLRVGPCSIIEHQLAALESRGVGPVVVVTGHGGEQLRELLGDRVDCVHNSRYAETNSIYSLWMARELVGEGFVLLNGDVLLDARLLGRLLDSPHPDALLVDFRDDLSDPELMRVRVDGSRLVEISKQIPPDQAHGENVGVLKFGEAGARRLFAEADRLIGQGIVNRWAPYVYNVMAPDYPLHTVAVDGLPWVEIDFAEDLERARVEVLPLFSRTSEGNGA